MKIAGHVNIDLSTEGAESITVDGEPFPWYLTEGPIQAEIERNAMAVVWLPVPCDRVTFTDRFANGEGSADD